VDLTQQLLDLLTAVGTMGAAAFAGWAALTSQKAATASSQMVGLERARDIDAREEERLHQARLVMVDCATNSVVDEAGHPVGVDLVIRVVNAGREPIHRVRLKAIAGEVTWGPQLVGNLAPGMAYTLVARMNASGDIENTDGIVRFVDTRQRAWIRSARGTLTEDNDRGLASWIDEGRRFAASAAGLSEPERGWIPENSLLAAVHEFREVLNLDPDGRARPSAPTSP